MKLSFFNINNANFFENSVHKEEQLKDKILGKTTRSKVSHLGPLIMKVNKGVRLKNNYSFKPVTYGLPEVMINRANNQGHIKRPNLKKNPRYLKLCSTLEFFEKKNVLEIDVTCSFSNI